MTPFYEYKTHILQINVGGKINFPPHLHISLELLYVKKGCIKTVISGKEYAVSAGEIAYIFPNLVHGYETITADAQTEYVMAIYNHTLAAGYKSVLDSFFPQNPVIPKEKVHRDIVYMMEALSDQSLSCEQTELIGAYITIILARGIPFLKLCQNDENVDTEIISQIIEYIGKSYEDTVTLEMLSKKFGISRYKISRIFSSKIGVGFSDYVNTLRISSARNALINTNESILNIGLASGFESQQSFNRVFKSKTGVSPKEYRKMYKLNKTS